MKFGDVLACRRQLRGNPGPLFGRSAQVLANGLAGGCWHPAPLEHRLRCHPSPYLIIDLPGGAGGKVGPLVPGDPQLRRHQHLVAHQSRQGLASPLRGRTVVGEADHRHIELVPQERGRQHWGCIDDVVVGVLLVDPGPGSLGSAWDQKDRLLRLETHHVRDCCDQFGWAGDLQWPCHLASPLLAVEPGRHRPVPDRLKKRHLHIEIGHSPTQGRARVSARCPRDPEDPFTGLTPHALSVCGRLSCVRKGTGRRASRVVMGLHKLTAGDGYTYLTRQVAAHDATDRGHSGLGDYYSERGESPGRWWGAGLAGLGVSAGSEVTEAQMRNLFGEGRHPDAQRLEEAALAAGRTVRQAETVSRLGRRFAIHQGASAFQREVAQRFVEYNYEHRRHWRTPVPPAVRAEIRTQVADEMFAREHGRAPLDDRERAGFLARASRQRTSAVAGYDLTFTPVKSVSVLWALADREVADQIEDAHHAAVERTLAYLEREALFTRRGRGGVQQVKASGLIAAIFTHRDARSGDPNLHSHAAVSNKVQDASGRWLAVDGRVLYKANVTLSETYNTLIEAELTARLGVEFAPRGSADHAPGRETCGARDRRRRRPPGAGLVAPLGRDRGPPPRARRSASRPRTAARRRRSSRSHSPSRRPWRPGRPSTPRAARPSSAPAGTARRCGSSGRPTRSPAMVAAALGRGPRRQKIAAGWVRETAAQVVATVAGDRATWQVWHLRAEAHRRIRASGIGLDDVEAATAGVVECAIREHSIAFEDPDPLADPGVSPAALTREDGASVYTVHGSQLYTCAATVEAERRLVETAQQSGGRRLSDVRVGIAVAETTANGVTLNAAQSAMVRTMATSGARLQLALAPAGTGKTTAMDVLARAWRDGGGTIVGLAPSAVAANELHQAVGGTCDTLSKLVWSLDPDHRTPGWVEAIDKKTLVIIDEAGMASTTDLAAAVEFITNRGGSVRLIGDDRQLAAVAAGGVLRDIASTAGAVTLTEVRRFRDPAEAAATLAVRDGDTSALGFYADRGRIHVGDLAGAADQAYAAWTTDVAAGKHSLLLAPTRELVAELNTRARNDRLTATTPSADASPRRCGSPTAPWPAPATPSSPAATTAPSGSARPTGSRTATAGRSSRPTPTGPSPPSTTSSAARSACPRTTSPTGTCSSATPPPSTAPKA